MGFGNLLWLLVMHSKYFQITILGPKAISKTFNDVHLCLYQYLRMLIILKTGESFRCSFLLYDDMYS